MKPDSSTTGPADETNRKENTGIRPDQRMTANPDVSCRIEGDSGAVLYNPDTERTRLINPTGIIVWKFISQPRTVPEIVDHVLASFGGSPDRDAVTKDIEQFVLELVPEFIREV